VDFHLFPYDIIPRHSNIIVYGAGNVGQEYLEQIEQTNWCVVICFADKDYARYKWMKITVRNPEDLFVDAVYDFVVIAIESLEIVDKVKNNLLKMGVPTEKIINVSERYLEKNRQKSICYDEETEKDDTVKIAYQIVGSMGTYIIYLKLLEEIVRVCPNCSVDVFCKIGQAKWFYEKHPNVRSLREYNELKSEKDKYDVVLKIGHVVRLERLFYNKVNRLCPELADKLRRLHDKFLNYYCNLNTHHLKDNLFIRKAGFLGINRFTALGHNGIFDLSDKRVNIPLDKNYEDAFNNLKLDKYITFNRGAACIPGENREQTKIWPREHFDTFILEFKSKFPNIKVVQIGAGDLEKLNGADRHYMGENMELVKYILKNAVFHLDCEGGLVHLATQLGTKCIVLFGPTSLQYFGYEQNINVSTNICNDCRWIAADWMVNCYRNGEKQICINSIAPETVLEKAESVLKSV